MKKDESYISREQWGDMEFTRLPAGKTVPNLSEKYRDVSEPLHTKIREIDEQDEAAFVAFGVIGGICFLLGLLAGWLIWR